MALYFHSNKLALRCQECQLSQKVLEKSNACAKSFSLWSLRTLIADV